MNVQPLYGITMGLTHIIPIPDAMGNVWNFTKYVEIPYECSAIIWYHYGTDPYHSHTRCYGECMELYEIRRNPIVKDNRAHWLRYPCYYMGSIWELTSHIKAIQHPYISHRLSHTISIFGPCMSHINSFGKGKLNTLFPLICYLSTYYRYIMKNGLNPGE